MPSIRNIYLLSKLRFLKTIFDPFTVIVSIFNLITIFTVSQIPLFTFDKTSEINIFTDIAISSTFISSLIISIYFSSSSIQSEIEDRTIFLIFSKKISKKDYLMGNFFGLMFVYFFIYMISFFLTDFICHLIDFELKDDNIGLLQIINSYFIDFYDTSWRLGSYFFLSAISLILFLSISISLGPFIPFSSNLIICLILYGLGNLAAEIEKLSKIMAIFHNLVFPQIHLFNLSDSIVLSAWYSPKFFIQCFLYSAAYSLFVLFLGSYFLEKKDLV